MKNLKVIDKYDHRKTWIIKIYKKGEIYFNQEIYGRRVYHKFTRTTKKYLSNLLERNINEIIDEDCRSKEEIAYRDKFIKTCRAHEQKILSENLPF